MTPEIEQNEWRRVKVLLCCALIMKVFLAWYLPLSVDEAYAIAVAREFSLSFFDHPPIAFWMPVLTAKLSGIEHAVIYRLPFLAFGLGTGVMLYLTAKLLHSARAGYWTVFLYIASPFFMLAGGVFVVPDSPLNLASVACVFFLIRIVKAGPDARLGDWFMAGMALAFALASKYQAGFIPVAALVFALAHAPSRRWFLTPGPYLATVVAAMGLAPVLLWNISNDWASFSFHQSRTFDGISLGNFATQQIGQMMYLLPSVAVLAVLGLLYGMRKPKQPAVSLLGLQALGPILAFEAIYLISDTSFPHWTMPGWLFALPLAGAYLAEKNLRLTKWYRGITVALAVPIWGVLLAASVHLNTGILTNYRSENLPIWDDTAGVFNYHGLRAALDADELLAGVEVVAAENWLSAATVSTGLKGAFPIRVLQGAPHHFRFMSGARITGDALLIAPTTIGKSQSETIRLLALARAFDPEAQVLSPLILKRGVNDYISVILISLEISKTMAESRRRF